MGLNVLNFMQGQASPGLSGYMDKGRMAEQDLMGKELGNIINKYKAENVQEIGAADLDLKRAQAEHQRMLAGGGGMTGMLGNLVKLHQLKQNPNADPNLVAKLEDQVAFERKREQGIYDYQQKVSDTLQYRAAPAQQKLLMNIDKLGQNKTYDMEGNEIQLTPAQAQQRRNILSKEILNHTTDPEERKRLRFANNFETTLQNINPEKAFKFSGGLGGIKKALEKGKSALTGKQSQEYKDFEKNLTALKLAAHQASQFFDLAAAQKIQAEIEELVNPESWIKSPEIAKAKFETLKKLFRQEHDNLLKTATQPGMYGFGISPSASGSDVDANEFVGAVNNAQNGSQDLSTLSPEELDAEIARLQNGG